MAPVASEAARDAHVVHLFHSRVQVGESPGNVLEQFPDEQHVTYNLIEEASYCSSEALGHFVH